MTMINRAQLRAPIFLLLLLQGYSVSALEPAECIQWQVTGSGDANYVNICSDPINLLYCVDHPQSEKSCKRDDIAVVTLHYNVQEIIPAYVAQGKPAVYLAICAYPQAPVGWKPEPKASYVCKKTCVMC